ncbi:MAG TPA: cytochrome c oxidase assembly protein [Rhodopila sp.]|nr:cytochrome c oxidase assembly protein [Rhodopila sp.]
MNEPASAPTAPSLLSEALAAAAGFVLWQLSPSVPDLPGPDLSGPTRLAGLLPASFSLVEFLGIAFPLIWYVRGLLLTPPARQPHWLRRTAFLAGIAVIYGVALTGFADEARHMFLLNRIQQACMHHLGPFLIALAWPAETLARGAPALITRLARLRPVTLLLRVLLNPIVAAVMFVGLIWLWLQPDLQARMMMSPALYTVMNASMVLDGLIFWFLVLDPRPSPPAYHSYVVRCITTIAVLFPQLIMGARLTFTTAALYPWYDQVGRLLPSVPALLDQHLGGIVVWLPSSLMSSIAFLLIMNNVRLNEDRQTGGKTKDDIEIAPGIRMSSTSWTGR